MANETDDSRMSLVQLADLRGQVQRAYETAPTRELRDQLISILAEIAFQHAASGAGEELLDDIETLLPFGAQDQVAALCEFIVEQFRAEAAVIIGLTNILQKYGAAALAGEVDDLPTRILLVLPPRPLSDGSVARFAKSVRQNLGEGELCIARRGDAELPPSLATATVPEFSARLARGFSIQVFIDGAGEYETADALAGVSLRVYRFDQADPGFEIRLMPVGREPRPVDYPHVAAHVFNRVTGKLHNHYYFFPYGYLYRYLGVGPLNAFGHRISADLAELRQRATNHKLIVCFGGSSCFSMYCLHDEMFSSRLEARLNQWGGAKDCDQRFTVLNFGQHGNVVLNQILTYLLFVQDLRPDVVISHDGFNDLAYGQVADSALVSDHHITYQDNLEDWSVILHGGREQMPGDAVIEGVRQIQNMPDAVVNAYLAREKQFAALAISSGARFVWGLQPYLLSKRRRSSAEAGFERNSLDVSNRYLDCYRGLPHLYGMVATRSGDIPGADFLDLHRAFDSLSREITHFFDIVHLSPAGDEVIATFYADHLISIFGEAAT